MTPATPLPYFIRLDDALSVREYRPVGEAHSPETLAALTAYGEARAARDKAYAERRAATTRAGRDKAHGEWEQADESCEVLLDALHDELETDLARRVRP